MTTTPTPRYTAEQLRGSAESLERRARNATNAEESLWNVYLSAVLRQAARDAETLATIRAALVQLSGPIRMDDEPRRFVDAVAQALGDAEGSR